MPEYISPEQSPLYFNTNLSEELGFYDFSNFLDFPGSFKPKNNFQESEGLVEATISKALNRFLVSEANIESLKNRMLSSLELLGQHLIQHDDKKLVLVFDLDDSLITQTTQLEDAYALDPDRAWELQQYWLIALVKFTDTYSNRVILIYNTSRSVPSNQRSFGTHSSYPINLSLVYRDFDEILPMVHFSEKPTNREYAIPMPDVLISSHGLQIEFMSASPEHRVILKEINQRLLSYYHHDLVFLENSCNQSSHLLTGMTISWNSGHNYCTLNRIPHYSSPLFSSHHLSQSFPKHVFTPVVRENSIEKAYVQSVLLNKGSALRLVIHLLNKMNVLVSGKFAVTIVGDTHMDLTMVRPDLEVKAAGIVSEQDIFVRELRMKELLGTDSEPNQVSQHWLLSINTDPDNLPRDKNPYTFLSLSHPKVVTLQDTGLAFIMDKIAEAIRTTDEP